jgi:hypothetical protein
MVHDFPEELLAEHDFVLQLAGKRVLPEISCVPDPRFSHEVESGSMDYCRALTLRIGPEKDRRPEDSLERAHEPPILGSTLLHAEGVQHLHRAPKANNATLLLDCQRCEEDRHQPVLPPRQSVCRMSSDLKKELAVPALMQKLPGPRLLHGQPTEDEWTRCKSEILVCFLPLQTDTGDRLGPTQPLFRDNELTMELAKNRSG